jgi:CheY-like chemotaxis protein
MSTRECQSVLYVDDDREGCEVVLKTLSSVPGLEVRVVGAGERAIDLAFELRPDLILMDVPTAEPGGPATLKRLRASPLIADIPVVLLTAHVSPTGAAESHDLGAIGAIARPFDPVTLADQLFALWRSTDFARGTNALLSDSAEMRAPSKSLADRFLDRARLDVDRLSDLLKRASSGDRTVLTDVERIAHSIHGTAAMFGFSALSGAGGAISRLAEGAIADATVPNAGAEPDMLQQLANHTQRLGREVEAAGLAPPSGEGIFPASRAGARSRDA